MIFDALLLSRIQFAITIMFHYIFPPLTIGLGILMVIMEGLYIKTGKVVYEDMTRFWTKIFAVNFAMGVASGIVMEFQFGTNWATYSRYVGDIFGPTLAAESIFAFFLESVFLAILVFGWDRVSTKIHFLSTILVAFGGTFSAVWIVIANSWQQTPAGYHIVQGPHGPRAEITNFWELIFNPSSMDRLIHVLIGCYILAAFFVMSISAYYIIKGRHLDFAKKSFTIALLFGTIACIAAPISGHSSALIVAEYQPAKLAAFEGHFTTGPGDLYAFGIPNTNTRQVDWGIPIPGGLSFLVTGDFTAPLKGLNAFPDKYQPPVHIPFFSFHIMVGIGTFLMALCIIGMIQLYRQKLFTSRWLLWVYVFAVVLPFIANQLGWVAAEVGRQPWIVYNLLTTADGLSKSVSAGQICWSIIMFITIYIMLFVVWIYVLNSKIKEGPEST